MQRELDEKRMIQAAHGRTIYESNHGKKAASRSKSNDRGCLNSLTPPSRDIAVSLHNQRVNQPSNFVSCEGFEKFKDQLQMLKEKLGDGQEQKINTIADVE